MTKMLAVIDVDDNLFEDYEYFFIEYDLRAERKNENFIESIKFVEDCCLIPIPKRKDEFVKLDSWILTDIINAEHRGYNKCIIEILSA